MLEEKHLEPNFHIHFTSFTHPQDFIFTITKVNRFRFVFLDHSFIRYILHWKLWSSTPCFFSKQSRV